MKKCPVYGPEVMGLNSGLTKRRLSDPCKSDTSKGIKLRKKSHDSRKLRFLAYFHG